MVLIFSVAKNRLPKAGQQADLLLLPPQKLTQATMSRVRLFREQLHKTGEEMFSLVKWRGRDRKRDADRLDRGAARQQPGDPGASGGRAAAG